MTPISSLQKKSAFIERKKCPEPRGAGELSVESLGMHYEQPIWEKWNLDEWGINGILSILSKS